MLRTPLNKLFFFDLEFLIKAFRSSGGIVLFALLLSACDTPWNNPYPAHLRQGSTFYSAFTERPKHLDPAIAYTEDEYNFIGQIYEPLLQYHYLKRPYQLMPATAQALPSVRYLDINGSELPAHLAERSPEKIAFSEFDISIRPGIRYAPHPAFALNKQGAPRYYPLSQEQIAGLRTFQDFSYQGTRELVVDDYIYQIKRLAHPKLHSPVYGLLSGYIVGLKELGDQLEAHLKALPEAERQTWLDLDKFALTGVTRIDKYRLRLRIKGKYPQMLYWLAMPFFSPVPREAERFYAQPGLSEKNITLDWHPVGTGPFSLTENNPNARMILEKNPLYRVETYPCEGEPSDQEQGLLADCGKRLPLIERVVFTREKESIPYWNKFLQGYYDVSGIASDSFDQAVRIDMGGDASVTDEMQDKNIRLLTSVRTSTYYLGFNQLDPVVGSSKEGAGSMEAERARKLRQAISIAIDQEEFISIFMNGRGVPAMSPLPPSIFGYQSGEKGLNRTVYDWVNDRPVRKSIAEARKLMTEAGYPNGREAKTGAPLVLNIDTTHAGLGDKSRMDWLTRQFKKIDIQLVVRSTDFNRFQEKIRKGAVQLYYLGWNADYPDPENFFFLLHGKEGKVLHGGENSSNYISDEFDRDFILMRNMENTPERLRIIDRMNMRLQNDAPWIFGFHPKSYTLAHAWVRNRKPNDVAQNIIKYMGIDNEARHVAQRDWNRPVLWPFVLLAIIGVIMALSLWSNEKRRDRQRA